MATSGWDEQRQSRCSYGIAHSAHRIIGPTWWSAEASLIEVTGERPSRRQGAGPQWSGQWP